jgi:hypothetical protein
MKIESDKKRGRGRPPVGISDTGKPALMSQYPKLCVYLPPLLKARLNAAAHIAGEPAWKLVNLAIENYLMSLPKADRTVLDALAGRLKENPKFQ